MKAILLRQYRAIYIIVPKVALTSLRTVIAHDLGMQLGSSSPHGRPYPEPKGTGRWAWSVRYRGFYKFGFVRNPWDRLLSCYKDKIQGKSAGGDTHFTLRRGVADCLASYAEFYEDMSFDAFVEAVAAIPDADANPHFRSQHTFFDPVQGVPADFVGRFEHLAEDWALVRDRIGFPQVDLPKRKSTPTIDYRDSYTPRTRDLVAQRFTADIEAFDYDF